MNFAIIGASGNVGRKTIEILEKSKISFKELYLVASKKSAGKKVKFREKEIEIENLENYDFSKAQITIFAAGSKIAKDWALKASKKTIVIDNSSFFRMQKNIPLVVPEVNPEALDKHENIIANPNCSTMQMVLALKPLHDEYKIKRVIVSTYQAVSGAGKEAMDELFDHIIKVKRTNVAILMVEQNAKQALNISDRGYVLVTGENKYSGTGKELLKFKIPAVRGSKSRKEAKIKIGDLLGNKDLINQINLEKYQDSNIGLLSLNDTKNELLKPGIDPRKDFKEWEFDPNVKHLEDLKTGMILPGIVTNLTAFFLLSIFSGGETG